MSRGRILRMSLRGYLPKAATIVPFNRANEEREEARRRYPAAL
jgi:hypothetical protein